MVIESIANVPLKKGFEGFVEPILGKRNENIPQIENIGENGLNDGNGAGKGLNEGKNEGKNNLSPLLSASSIRGSEQAFYNSFLSDLSDPFSCDDKDIELVAKTLNKALNGQMEWYSTPTKCRWDMECRYRGKKDFIVECKARDFSSTRFPDWILEDHKYRDLKEEAGIRQCRAFYANSFTDDKMVLWDIDKVNAGTKRGKISRKRTTVIDTGMKSTASYLLEIKDAVLMADIVKEGYSGYRGKGNGFKYRTS